MCKNNFLIHPSPKTNKNKDKEYWQSAKDEEQSTNDEG